MPASELARLLGISIPHLWACHSSGTLGPQPVAFGRAKRWYLAEVHAWLAAGAPRRDQWDAPELAVSPVELARSESCRD